MTSFVRAAKFGVIYLIALHLAAIPFPEVFQPSLPRGILIGVLGVAIYRTIDLWNERRKTH